jgi:hypothetical protein
VALRYAVTAHDGRWRYDVLLDDAHFAERRHHEASGDTWTLGMDRNGAWLSANERSPVSVGEEWDAEVRTRQALFSLDFLRHTRSLVRMGRATSGWELAYPTPQGRTLTLGLGADGRPVWLDWVDRNDGLVTCDRLELTRHANRTVIARADCTGIVSELGRRGASMELVSAALPRTRSDAAWAYAPTRHAAPDRLTASRIPITDPLRIHVPVHGVDGEPHAFVLDSGAFATVVAASAAKQLGVVRSGRVPVMSGGPWIGYQNKWVGVVDRLWIGNAIVHGAQVLVMPDDAPLRDSAGLLGRDLFRRMVVDVDSPRRLVTLRDRKTFRPWPEAYRLWTSGRAGRPVLVPGSVAGVVDGDILLDTGATEELVVHHWAMTAAHPRRRDSVVVSGPPDSRGAPDYYAEVAGVTLGPFSFPAMPVLVHDYLDQLPGVALAGMGLMQHLRVAFDLRNGRLFASAGRSDHALRTASLPGDPRNDGA